MKRFSFFGTAIAALPMLLFPLCAQAGTLSSSPTVIQTSVVANCSGVKIDTGGNLDNYDPLASSALGGASEFFNFGVYCTKSTSVTLTVDQGSNWDAGCACRNFKNTVASDVLAYGLFTDSGDTTPVGASNLTATGSGSSWVDTPVYIQLPALQNVVPGTYQDTITLSAAF